MPFVFLDRKVNPLVAGLILATLVLSAVAALDGRADGQLYEHLALIPEHVWHGQLWRLFTWVLVEGAPVSLVIGVIATWWFGGDLAEAWGTARLARFLATVLVVAGAVTCLVPMLLPAGWRLAHLGGFALRTSLLIAWALQFPAQKLTFYGAFEAGGLRLAQGVVAFTAAFALFFGFLSFVPELAAQGTAFYLMTQRLR